MNITQKKADESVLKKLRQAYRDETKARKLFESWRWPTGRFVRIATALAKKEISKLVAQATDQCRVRPGVYFCGACRRQFTTAAGTVLERSYIPLSKWVMALSLLCSSKKFPLGWQLPVLQAFLAVYSPGITIL